MSDESATPQKTASGPLVMLGDSLVAEGPWDAALDREVVNAGVPGETTGDVETRLQDVIDLDPSAVVVEVGTNDLGQRATVEQVVRGTENILFNLRHELPDARLIVCSVLPRERERADYVREVNIHLRQFSTTVKAEFLDLWPEYAADDGSLRADLTRDGLHLTEQGYDAWVRQLRELLG